MVEISVKINETIHGMDIDITTKGTGNENELSVAEVLLDKICDTTQKFLDEVYN